MNAQPIIWVNGRRQADLPVTDRGLQYGDGFFTTALIVCGRLLNWQAHWRRLQNSAVRLKMPELCQASLLAEIKNALAELTSIETHADNAWILKILITRGSGGRGYQPPREAEITRILQFSHTTDAFSCGASAIELPIQAAMSIPVCITLSGMQPQLAGIKHLNRLENVLARAELEESPEGLMLNGAGEVIGGTQSNLFVVKDGRLLTPILDLSGVEGTCRYQLLRLAEEQMQGAQEVRLKLLDLQGADSVFLANAVRGIMPVRELKTGMGTWHFANREVAEWQRLWQKFQRENGLDLHVD
ncbi:aminodeoxychorismate lyase [Thiomicrorhabdus heinhorstiae]|uniref:Aminodeoxychorismate lyase n=1 Tax=Thiomicrorhabdus heinhorstiae TaxID=2748010 RepID=A0ABS0BXL2_9GAMM|nr:aminodeoxychorismate lyase [Thiomicrorhabdus heinhorstiae]MBF6058530.1 aminodeoxychorismate lyase [Thiomicrorhabdus heinhorstiae]